MKIVAEIAALWFLYIGKKNTMCFNVCDTINNNFIIQQHLNNGFFNVLLESTILKEDFKIFYIQKIRADGMTQILYISLSYFFTFFSFDKYWLEIF